MLYCFRRILIITEDRSIPELIFKFVIEIVLEKDWEDIKKMPEHQTLVKDFKKSK